MEDESGKIIIEIERGKERERDTQDEKDAKTINKIQTFVEGHWDKNRLYYFVHEHRMELLYRLIEIKIDGSVICCSDCASTITDFSYVACWKCKCFLHEQCAERPKEITHPVHKSHPLTLQPVEHPNSGSCSGCDLSLRGTSYYGCIACSVYFHKFCLELPLKIIHEAYESCFADPCDPHYLVLNYNGAGEVLESRTAFSYVCDKCDFATSIPELVSKTIGHILALVPPYPTEVTKRFHNFKDYYYSNPFDPRAICFICGEALRSLGFFHCWSCKLYVHVGCALPPSFKSDHHRHLLKLISDSADDHFCSTSTDYDDFYCNHCEKQLHPGLAVYKCPETDCGGFVAHCYCEFLQGGVSICHVPDYEEMGTERVVMVKYHFVTVLEVESKWVQELTSLNDDIRVEGNEKVKKLFKEEDFVGCSDFAEFMEKNEYRYFDILDEGRRFSLGVVEEVGEYLVAKELAPILKGLFKRYGDFSAKSILPPKARLLVFNYLCYAISKICTSKQINNRKLYLLLESLKIAACARFEIQFAVELFKKAFLARTLDDLDSVDEQSVVSSDNDDLDSVDDQAMDELDRDIRRIMKEEVGQLSKSYVSYSGSRSDVRIMPVLTNPEGEPTVQALEIQNNIRNSWFRYLKSLKIESIPEKEEISFHRFITTMLLWDYQSVMNNINRFIEQHCMTTNVDIQTTANFEVCCYGCELRTYNEGASYHRCTISTCRYSNLLRQTNLPRYGLDTIKSTIHCNHDVTHFQEPPSDYGLDTIEYMSATKRTIESIFGRAAADECCFVCGLPLWGTSYGCEKHGSFHKHCVQIPLEIQHFLHPLHSLVLRPNSEIGKQRCYACGRNCHGCAFSCSDCSFFVEVQCVFRKETFKCESHEHLLTVFDAETETYPPPNCPTCTMTIKQELYLYCGLCNFSYHAKCVLPSTITSSHHRHPLTIVESHMPDDSYEFYCTACEDRIKPGHPVYCCFECFKGNNYTAHIVCALSEMEPNDLPEELNIEKYLSDPISNEALITSDLNKCFYYEGKVQSVRREHNIPRTTSGDFTDKCGDQGRWEESKGNRTIRRTRSADFIDKSGDQGRWEESEGNRTIRRTRSANFTDKSGDQREPNDHPEALFTEKNLSDPIGRCSNEVWILKAMLSMKGSA
ncbi:hypothetical protein Vadar_033961 [Vaccinium darrowii]|uniref:Uncharacterized protein n=1 Tax=Vaccinium darrowii TaxID=229202 RepID=A0ACB7Y3R5_9ERIC|nr:hypothetical protein Vadar_033961 [Vaccinium darrowii]